MFVGTENKQFTDPGAMAMSWFEDMKKMIDKVRLPGVDVAALIDWQRKDIEALTEANRQAYEGVKTLIERRNEMLREAFSQWQTTMKDASGADAISKQTELAKQSVEKAVANFRELSEMEAQARTNAWKVVQERMQENMANLQKLFQPK
jgi:phasin family protein